jgi:hypothetical protein
MNCGTGKQIAANHGNFSTLQFVGLDLFYGMLLQARKRCADVNWLQVSQQNEKSMPVMIKATPLHRVGFDHIHGNDLQPDSTQGRIGKPLLLNSPGVPLTPATEG